MMNPIKKVLLVIFLVIVIISMAVPAAVLSHIAR